MKEAHDLVAEAKAHIEEVSVAQADEAIRQAGIVIDVREADEFQQGHVAGAVNIPRGLLEFKLSGAPELASRDLNIVLYCKTSGRAALAAKSLREMGYLNVKSISGGFDAWLEAGKPVAKPETLDFE